jgi:hypothetical protein
MKIEKLTLVKWADYWLLAGSQGPSQFHEDDLCRGFQQTGAVRHAWGVLVGGVHCVPQLMLASTVKVIIWAAASMIKDINIQNFA